MSDLISRDDVSDLKNQGEVGADKADSNLQQSFMAWAQKGRDFFVKGKGASILILEDDPAFGPLLVMALEDEGYRVSLQTTASKALDYIDENDVDLVISDLLIKSQDTYVQDGGIKLISTLKQIRNHPAPIIAISGSFAQDQYHAISTAMTVGADKTLAKPIHPDDLIGIIRQYIGS